MWKRLLSTSSPQAQATQAEHVGQLWLDNLSTSDRILRYSPPLFAWINRWRPEHLRILTKQRLIQNAVREFIPPHAPHDFRLTDVIPKTRDGGVLLQFTFRPANAVPPDVAKSDIVRSIRQHCRSTPTSDIQPSYGYFSWLRPGFWVGISQVRAFLVKGEPFLEDFLSRTGSRRLKVELQGSTGDVPFETLYREFRPFGRMVDIVQPMPPPKDVPKFVSVQYINFRDAASAKNCLHGYRINGSRLNIQYEPVLQVNTVRRWLMDHPRVSVPLAAASALAVSYTIFDPIRIYSITAHMTTDSRFTHFFYKAYDFIRSWVMYGYTYVYSKPGTHADQLDGKSSNESAVWMGRQEARASLETWLGESPRSVMVLIGPQGCGKTDVVKAAIKDKKYKLVIRCDDLMKQSGTRVISDLSSQIGYFPVFASLNWIPTILDTLLTASGGQKVGFSDTIESQAKKILDLSVVAVSHIVETQKKRSKYSGEDESFLESGQVPESLSHVDYPVIVIDTFSSPSATSAQYITQQPHHRYLYQALIEWAAVLAQSGLAHVIIIGSDVGVGGSDEDGLGLLAKALPTRLFESIHFTDASKEAAMAFLKARLGSDWESLTGGAEHLERAVTYLGGRLGDLESFSQKLRSGAAVDDAVRELVLRAMLEVRKFGLGEDMVALAEGERRIPWTPVQFWYVLKAVAKSTEAGYDAIRHSPLFKGDDSALKMMERAELISIVHENGHPTLIRPGKPIYLTAFREILAADPAISFSTDATSSHPRSDEPIENTTVASMDLLLYKYLIDYETKKMHEYEQELRVLSESLEYLQKPLADSSSSAKDNIQSGSMKRIQFLTGLIASGQEKVEKYWKEWEHCKGVLAAAPATAPAPKKDRKRGWVW